MIRLTRKNGKEFILNAELIKFVEETPDTIITLVGGEKFMVAEAADIVVDKAIQFARMVRSLPWQSTQ